METIDTILKNISQAKKIAIALPYEVTIDVACAAIALQAILTDQPNKPSIQIFSSAANLPSVPFLAETPRIASGLGGTDELAIKVSNQNAKPGQLRYETTPNGLTIYITQSSGEFKEADVTVLPSSGTFDLVIILGAHNFEQLGSLYTDNTKLFFGTPNVNIDTNPANEFYGTVNLVNTTVSSLSELVMDIVEAIPQGLSKDIVVTSLLAGIISQTASFRDPKTTPSALLKASRLVTAGARQQDIIQHLFKTKPLPLLQLWGRALARLSAMPEKQALLAVVTASDLEKTKVTTESLPIVLRDIIEMVTGFSLVVLLAELSTTKGVQILIAGLPYEQINQLAQKLGASVTKTASLVGKYDFLSFQVPETLGEVQRKITEMIEHRSSVV